jgi:hypothetical protein
MRDDFCSSRPALHGFRWLSLPPSARSPSKAGGPVVVPDGRVTRRLAASTCAGVAAHGRRPGAVCKDLPRRGFRSSRTAGAAPRPRCRSLIRQRPRGGGDRASMGAGGQTGISLRRLNFWGRRHSRERPGCHSRESGNPEHRAFAPGFPIGLPAVGPHPHRSPVGILTVRF